MSTIFEIFGHRLDDTSDEARSHRASAWCPFMNAKCDGGGNRFSTQIDLTKAIHEDLKAVFPALDTVIPGVCSLRPIEGEPAWIVCPRRLLVLGRQHTEDRKYQRRLEARLLKLLDYAPGTRLGIWREVKVNHVGRHNNQAKEFDYTFDYVLMPIVDIAIGDLISSEEPAMALPINAKVIAQKKKLLSKKGFQPTADANVSGGYIVHDYPFGKPSLIEIMTSSTSGGNKKTRTQIPQAFEDAMLGQKHKGPGINYRQVWARMASQLLVKSEVAHGWGGTAIWVVQDVLVDYISKSTGLNVQVFAREQLDEVNILSFSYGEPSKLPTEGVLDLPIAELISGKVAPPILEQTEAYPSFTDIIRLPIQPPLSKLRKLLSDNGPVTYHLTVPS